MNESKKRFVEELLAADPPSADARQRYETRRHEMFEKTLTRGERRGYLVTSVLLGLLALACAIQGLFGWVYHGDAAGVGVVAAAFLLTTGALLVVAGVMFWAGRTGVLGRRTEGNWAAGAGVAYAGLVGCVSLLMVQTLPEGTRDAGWVVGLVLLVYAAVVWVRHRVAQAELRTAERLLEIELRLAEIGEALQAKNGQAPTPPS